MNAAVESTTRFVEDDEISLSDYLAIVKRRKKLFFLVMSVVVVLAIGLAMSLPPIYRSTATVLVQQQETTGDLLDASLGEQADQTIDYLVRKIMKEDMLWAIIEKFDMFPEFRDKLPKGSLIAKMKGGISVSMVGSEVGNVKKRGGAQSSQMAFDISFEYKRDPEVAQKVTNEIVAIFVRENIEKRKKITSGTTQFLASQAEKLQQKIDAVGDKFSKFKEENNGLLPAQIRVLISERERTERELLGVEQQITTIRSSTIGLRGQLAGTKPFIYEDRTLIRNTEGERVLSTSGRLQTLQQSYHELLSRYSPQHPKVRKLKKEIESLGGNVNEMAVNPLSRDNLELARNQLSEARQKYSPDHPNVIKLEKKLTRLEAQSGSAVGNANTKEFNSFKRVNPAFSALTSGVSRGESEMNSLLVRRSQLKGNLDDYARRLGASPEIEKDYERLEREHQDYITEYRELRKKLSSAELLGALEDEQKGELFSLQDSASFPLSPVKPNRPAIILLGTLLAGGFAFALVMLLESMDDSVTSRRALIKLVGAHPIGTIPLIMTTSETELIKRQNMIRAIIVIGGVFVFGLLMTWIHFYVIPLSEIWQAISRRVELMAF